MNKVITVSREFGSGGRELGVKLAETLGIPFYDKELISMAADDINIAEEAFRKYDEHVIEDDPLDHKIHHSFSELYKVPMSDQIFVAQSNVIRILASHGPCVIVGRCADYILETSGKTDLVKIFVYADLSTCVRRTQETDGITDTKEALNKLNRITKQRKSYHKYFTGKEWEDVTNYDLPINASKLELDQVVELIKDYIRMIGYDI